MFDEYDRARRSASIPGNNYEPWYVEENLLVTAATGNPCDLHSIEHLAHNCRALASTRARRRDQRLDDNPLLVADITWIAPTSRLVRLALFVRPHGSRRLAPQVDATSHKP
jgi:hypothetical protein